MQSLRSIEPKLIDVGAAILPAVRDESLAALEVDCVHCGEANCLVPAGCQYRLESKGREPSGFDAEFGFPHQAARAVPLIAAKTKRQRVPADQLNRMPDMEG